LDRLQKCQFPLMSSWCRGNVHMAAIMPIMRF
jgi:hypothetical protein